MRYSKNDKAENMRYSKNAGEFLKNRYYDEEEMGKMKENVLVSACLLGVNCRYDGGNNRIEELEKLKERYHLIPVCPEQLGGLTTPRQPSEIQNGKVTAKDGSDVTLQYERGAAEALKLAQMFGCRCAILKARSPSCGSGEIYDGTFSKTRIPGDGKAAALLKENGIHVYTELELNEWKKQGNPIDTDLRSEYD